MIENALRGFADKGVWISVAAGNKDELAPHSGYVQMVSPARAGAYRYKKTSGDPVTGAIITISAVSSTKPSGPWVDEFWDGSAFEKAILIMLSQALM